MKVPDGAAIDWKIGQSIPDLVLPPIERSTLAAYATASNDYAPIHLDTENAKSYGFPDVIAHGLLIMAYLGRTVTNCAPPRSLKTFSARFTSSVNIGDRLTCKGTITDINEDCAGARLIQLELVAVDQHGSEKIRGKATILR